MTDGIISLALTCFGVLLVALVPEFRAVFCAWLAVMRAAVAVLMPARQPAQAQPHPDYSAIAAMEREIYGETFQHEEAPKAAALGRERKESPKPVRCYCNYCYGRAGVHGDDAKALYQAEVAAVMTAIPSVKPADRAYGTSNVNYGGVVGYWTEQAVGTISYTAMTVGPTDPEDGGAGDGGLCSGHCPYRG